MAFNIEDFLSAIDVKGGVLRSNHFKVFFTPPPVLSGRLDEFRDMEFLAEAVTLPGVNLSTHEVRRYGYGSVEKRVLAPTFTDCNVTFIGDGYGDVHRVIHDWISSAIPFNMSQGIQSGAYLVDYKANYATDLHILLYNDREATEHIVDLTLREAYPIAMTDTNFAWADTNNYARFTVQFAYIDWFLETVN